jgi:hypothetical protein
MGQALKAKDKGPGGGAKTQCPAMRRKPVARSRFGRPATTGSGIGRSVMRMRRKSEGDHRLADKKGVWARSFRLRRGKEDQESQAVHPGRHAESLAERCRSSCRIQDRDGTFHLLRRARRLFPLSGALERGNWRS